MNTTEVSGGASRFDRWLGEHFDRLLPWKRRAEAFYCGRRAKRAENRGDYEAAREYYDRAVGTRGRLGDREATITLGLRLADLAREHGDAATAREHYERVVELHARRENARGALDALEPMLDVLDAEGEDDELARWWGHALMILGKAEPGELSAERRDDLIRRYADRIRTEESAGRLYGFALRRLLADEDELGAELLDATWERRDVVREQVGQFRVVLAAGVGRVAHAECTGRDVDREETLDFVADHRGRLSVSAAALFERLRDGETDAEPADLKTGVGPDDEAELRDVEAEAFGRLLERLG
ncbi:tetratricopeptide repeat protein [Halorussus aquaticus]|uniref:Tol-pal system YbgF family protein n=1 Tax=Halorussus aquaticus TaxID=2953748 RepID=A0ABD5Q643_9EURY|nr:tetratricopeptide repeat protein [Halorussus aquaticus]